MNLKPFAANPQKSLGRQFKEVPSKLRNDFQRDRDRIIHSGAFRRLEYKTQVFVNHEGDMFRTRLTHSLEVAQIARGISRTLGLHEDLAEAISLAHDLGHTPFGHAGQTTLNQLMKEYGGFEHNLQSLRIVDVLENDYVDFKGLNLTFETREGILKHCSQKNALKLGRIGERFIQKKQPSLEAQLVNFADEIAYNHHDIDDGFRSGLLNFDQLQEIPFFKEIALKVKSVSPSINDRQCMRATIRRMMNIFVMDLCHESQVRIDKKNMNTIDDVRNEEAIIALSEDLTKKQQSLKQFLRKALYLHPRVKVMTDNAHEVISLLFKKLMQNPSLINIDEHHNQHDLAKFVSDYIAGMTDRFALQTFEKLC
ncbi:deoxyguanosinetriphosphate triphosphohydrolase [Nitrosomonadales bacterium]|jgi:dGTPase|nr:deoxyguanosinetriphosphate triphosphohydrolase [Methylophilaceae bacterium]MDA9600349.1 deoxyguanosinetriphosphate triphosphohydrolase [Nitrosomonadales bacterium]